jgi:NADH-quinone oxidoreductase subunit E
MDEILLKYPKGQLSQLVPVLRDVQQKKGYLTQEDVRIISDHLAVSTTRIYAVATFYTGFRFDPPGRNHICLCRGTACHVAGGNELKREFERTIGISVGQTGKDGLFSLEATGCLGACERGPVVTVNGKITAVSPDEVKELVSKLVND